MLGLIDRLMDPADIAGVTLLCHTPQVLGPQVFQKVPRYHQQHLRKVIFFDLMIIV